MKNILNILNVRVAAGVALSVSFLGGLPMMASADQGTVNLFSALNKYDIPPNLNPLRATLAWMQSNAQTQTVMLPSLNGYISGGQQVGVSSFPANLTLTLWPTAKGSPSISSAKISLSVNCQNFLASAEQPYLIVNLYGDNSAASCSGILSKPTNQAGAVNCPLLTSQSGLSGSPDIYYNYVIYDNKTGASCTG